MNHLIGTHTTVNGKNATVILFKTFAGLCFVSLCDDVINDVCSTLDVFRIVEYKHTQSYSCKRDYIVTLEIISCIMYM